MGKLTKKQLGTISTALSRLDAAQAFIMRPETHVVTETQNAAFPSSAWTNGEGTRGVSITKEYGSQLVGMADAARILRAMLANGE